MKLLVALPALLSLSLAAEESKLLPYPGYAPYPYSALPYHGYPYAYAASSLPAPLTAPVSVAAPAVAAPAVVASQAVVASPAVVAPYAAPAVAPAAVAPYAAFAPYTAGSQFHAQDEFGNLNYGYTNINSVKQEVGNTYGGVSGGYSYVDASGKLQQVTYQADALGFRTQDSRLPVAPVYEGVAPTFNPEPLVAPTFSPEPLVAPSDTPEVAAAKAEHLAALEAAKAGKEKREAEPAFAYGFATAHPAYAATYAAPLHYAAHNYGYAGAYTLPYLL